MFSIFITVLITILWAVFAKKAYARIKGYHLFRQNRGRGDLQETVMRNKMDCLVLLIGVVIPIQLLIQISDYAAMKGYW